MPLYFHSEDSDYRLKDQQGHINWIEKVIDDFGKVSGDLNIIFTSNDFLLEINKKYLNHNYFTDVITFDYSLESIISGDIFVSIDQVRLNAEDLNTGFENELNRVMIHGVLHLLGFNDKTKEEKTIMREKEDQALLILK